LLDVSQQDENIVTLRRAFLPDGMAKPPFEDEFESLEREEVLNGSEDDEEELGVTGDADPHAIGAYATQREQGSAR
jgi:hypothetical protein